MITRFAIRIIGRVQGVGYRYAARQQALRLGLQGFARNEDDGSVYAEVQGEKDKADLFIAWCRKGPPHASVESVQSTELSPNAITGFFIR